MSAQYHLIDMQTRLREIRIALSNMLKQVSQKIPISKMKNWLNMCPSMKSYFRGRVNHKLQIKLRVFTFVKQVNNPDVHVHWKLNEIPWNEHDKKYFFEELF